MSERTCPGCGAPLGAPEVYVDAIPTTMNRAMDEPARAEEAARGSIALCVCPRCALVTNVAFDERASSVHFDTTYSCAQHHSGAWRARVERALDAILASGRHRRVVEIGSGSGWVLERLAARGLDVSGFDPTHDGSNPHIARRLYVPGEPLDADLVYVQHVLDEVPSPRALLEGLRASAPGASVYIDVLDAGETFARGEVWDLAYERVHYFTREALGALFERPRWIDFDDGYLRLVAELAELVDAPRAASAPSLAALADMRRALAARAESMRREESAPIYVWGASNRGGNLVNVLDPRRERVRACVDLNPAKHGRFVPGTGHRIVSPQELARMPEGVVVVSNPAYVEEVQETMRALGAGAWEIVGRDVWLEEEG